MTTTEMQLIQNRRFVLKDHSIRILRQLSPDVARELRHRIIKRYPGAENCQFINTGSPRGGWGQFRICPARGHYVPQELTNEIAAAILADIEAEHRALSPF